MVSKSTVGAGWQRAILTLTGTVVGVVVIGTLYWAQSVFIPVALAGFLTFLLSPLVNRLRQHGLPRTPSVIVVVLLAATALGGVGWLVTDQISSLLQELPKYRQTVKDKVRTVKQATGRHGRAPGDDRGRQQGARQGPGSLGGRRRRGGPRTARQAPTAAAGHRPRRPPWSSSRNGPPGCRG